MKYNVSFHLLNDSGFSKLVCHQKRYFQDFHLFKLILEFVLEKIRVECAILNLTKKKVQYDHNEQIEFENIGKCHARYN